MGKRRRPRRPDVPDDDDEMLDMLSYRRGLHVREALPLFR